MSRRRHLSRAAAAGLLTATALLTTTAPASADPEVVALSAEISPVAAGNLAMIVDAVTGAVKLVDSASVSHAEKTWLVSHSTGTMTIRKGGTCLGATSGVDAARVVTAPCDGSAAQLWNSQYTGPANTSNRLLTNSAFGTVLTADPSGGSVSTRPSGVNKAEQRRQLWIFDF